MERSSLTTRWISLFVGVAAIIAGAALTLKPFSSLDALTLFIGVALILTGVGEFLDDEGERNLTKLASWLIIGTGIAALLLRDQTIRAIAIAMGVGLILSGLTRILSLIRGRSNERYAAFVGGVAAVILGALALAWPDVSILALALMIGPVAVIFGVSRVWRAIFGAKESGDRHVSTSKAPSGLRRFANIGRATLAIVVALALVGISSFLNSDEPEVGAFYEAPGDLPNSPGQLVRSEDFDRAMPDNSRAKKILYTTTGLDGDIIVASGLVFVPEEETTEPFSVVLWAHGTTGVAQKCAPSILESPLDAGAMPARQEAIDAGWAIVAPDYIGLGGQDQHPYLVGVPTAQSSLDAVRAARQLEDMNIGNQTVVWGHSQGGGVALWVGIESLTYATDVPLLGVAAMAPASDLTLLADGMMANAGGPLFASFILYGFSAAYDDVRIDDYIRPAAREIVAQIQDRCLAEPTIILSIAALASGEEILSTDFLSGALATRFAENVPSTVTGIPTFLGQGAADDLVVPVGQAQFVANICSAGQVVEYHTYAERDHLSVVAEDSPMIGDLMRWTEARFTGEPAANACSTIEQ
jgi:uncharacterized membrane protein HdeD (DUF308 family)/acetyl esterase/lipase